MKKTFLLIILVLIAYPLLSDNHFLDKGQRGIFLSLAKNSSTFGYRVYEMTTGYTFKNGSSLRCLYDHFSEELWTIEYMPSRMWYNRLGFEYDLIINDQRSGKLPLDISIITGYHFNRFVYDYGEGSESSINMAHTYDAGFVLSRDFKLFNVIELIPLIKGEILYHQNYLIDGTIANSLVQTVQLSAKLSLKYKFIYGFIGYSKEYDHVSLNAIFNGGWQAGLGFILAQ